MKIKYFGHSSFLITSDSGTKIITDPYTPNQDLTYGKIKDTADVVTISHNHGDHNNAESIKGNPKIISTTAKANFKGIVFNGITVYHDDAKGTLRGKNIIFYFEVDGVKVVHLGDLGHKLDARQVAELDKVDILLIPVGGRFTLDATSATEVYQQINPKLTIPMHYKTEKCKFLPDVVDGFIKGKQNAAFTDSSEMVFKPDTFDEKPQILVLIPAL